MLHCIRRSITPRIRKLSPIVITSTVNNENIFSRTTLHFYHRSNIINHKEDITIDAFENKSWVNTTKKNDEHHEEVKVTKNNSEEDDSKVEEEDEMEEMFVDSDPILGLDGDSKEWGGPRRGGRFPEPTRYGDWERKGRTSDF